MTWQQLVGICIGTAAILAAGYGILRVLRDLVLGARRLGRMLDDWLGEPEQLGIPGTGRPGVLARLSSLEENVSSMKVDLSAVQRLELRVAQLEAQLRASGELARPKIEAGGVGFQAERAFEVEESAAHVRLPYGFIEQRSR